MPKVKISEYSATANSNTDVASINIDEGCAPSGINNAIRAVMGHLKDFQQGTNGDPFNGPVNGTVGATTANTGAFTTLSATGVTTVQAGTASLPAITTTGDTNTGIWFPAADTIAFTEGGVESMRINASGNLGIGTSSPARKLDVAGTTYAANEINGLRLNSVGSIAANYFDVLFGLDGSGNPYGSLQTGNQANSYITFLTGSGPTERARFNSTGAFVFAGGTTTADGIGITFPATQSASSNANTLDDYEEGTFDVTITATTSGTVTLNSAINSLAYTKVGRLVTVTGLIVISSVSSPLGGVAINGLPFAIANLAKDGGSIGGSIVFQDAPTYTTTTVGFTADEGNTSFLTNQSAAVLGADDQYRISFLYFTS